MRIYADTSFIVKLLAHEPGTEQAVAEYRRLGRPTLVFLPLHALEVENAIRARAFHQRHSSRSKEWPRISQEEESVLKRLEHFLSRGILIEAGGDWDDACQRARDLSRKYSSSTGARSLDLLHLAFALEFDCELFLSTDECQAKVAGAEGLKVVFNSD